MDSFLPDCDSVEDVCATTENRRDGNEYLKKLNDRLSSYIYRLRQFEKENNKEEGFKKESSPEEDICDKISNIRREFEGKLHNARCEVEKCVEINQKRKDELNRLHRELNEAEAAQDKAQKDAETLRVNLRLERDLHRQEIKSIGCQNQMMTHRIQITISDKYKAKLNDELSNLRRKLEDELRTNRLYINGQIKHISRAPVDRAGESITKMVADHDTVGTIISQISGLKSKLAKCKASVSAIEKEIEHWKKVLDGDEAQMDHLKNLITDLCQRYQKLLEDKVKIQSELKAYDNLLKCEENRLNVSHMCCDL